MDNNIISKRDCTALIGDHMWKDIKLKYDGKISRLADEFEITMPDVLPYNKMKVRIYEEANGRFTGRTDVMIVRKNGSPESSFGYGATVEEALGDTIRYFIQMVEEDYLIDGTVRLCASDIRYAESSDF